MPAERAVLGLEAARVGSCTVSPLQVGIKKELRISQLSQGWDGLMIERTGRSILSVIHLDLWTSSGP